MLTINGLYKFYFIKNFHDMRCKYERIRSMIRTQFNREPQAGEVFIMMSKDRQLVRLYHYDSRSCSLHEKKFNKGYRFMEVAWEGETPYYYIDWKDVVTMLESPVIKRLPLRENPVA